VLESASFVGFVPVTDLARAREFYVDRLGLAATDESPFALAVDAGGTMLRLTLVEQLSPQQFTIAGWAVPDIAATIDAMVEAGVAFTRYDGMDQDERGVWTPPSGAKVAWFRDPDDNVLSLTEF
jgi:catechol 2,3-dioxygenase-like lactoylglutathione lyase family enzyme